MKSVYHYKTSETSKKDNLSGSCIYGDTVFGKYKEQENYFQMSTGSRHEMRCDLNRNIFGYVNIKCIQWARGYGDIKRKNAGYVHIWVPVFYNGKFHCIKKKDNLICKGFGHRETFEKMIFKTTYSEGHGCKETFEQTIFGKEEEKEK